MPDILATGEFGRDDGIKCDDCGGKTYLTDDQGYGLCTYQCEDEKCGLSFQVQFEWDGDDIDDDDYPYEDLPPEAFMEILE